MNRRTIYILVVLMSMGMIGIISIQYFWIKNALDLRKVQFNRSVIEAMNEVSFKVQKEDLNRQFERLKFTENAFEVDSFGNVHVAVTDDSQALIVMGDADSVIEINQGSVDVMINYGDDYVVHKKVEELPAIQEVYEIAEAERVWMERKDSITVELKELNEKLEERYLIYEHMLEELAEFQLESSWEDRINMEKIGDQLRIAFKNRGLDVEFDYAVVSPHDPEMDNFFFVEGESDFEKMYRSPFQVAMFPGSNYEGNFNLSVVFPNIRSDIWQSMGMLLFVSVFFILIVIGVFIATIRTIFRQKKLSEIKNDFISNMTHELKTPISTISLACEALGDKSIEISEERHDTFIGMIRSENKRLGVLVEKVLRNAVLDKGEIKLREDSIDVNELIRELNQFNLQIRKQGGELIKELSNEDPVIIADRVHLTNIISNLIDNAIKYSPESPKVRIRTEVKEQYLCIEVADNGIGINKEHMNKIFDKFFRVPTGNVHNVKGFGLGLSYVYDVVQRFGGSISVSSEIKKGSKFTIKLPLKHESES